jgi:hypothetical protein
MNGIRKNPLRPIAPHRGVSFLLCLLVAINGSFWVRQTADAHLQTEIRYNLGLDSCDVNGLRTAALQA